MLALVSSRRRSPRRRWGCWPGAVTAVRTASCAARRWAASSASPRRTARRRPLSAARRASACSAPRTPTAPAPLLPATRARTRAGRPARPTAAAAASSAAPVSCATRRPAPAWAASPRPAAPRRAPSVTRTRRRACSASSTPTAPGRRRAAETTPACSARRARIARARRPCAATTARAAPGAPATRSARPRPRPSATRRRTSASRASRTPIAPARRAARTAACRPRTARAQGAARSASRTAAWSAVRRRPTRGSRGARPGSGASPARASERGAGRGRGPRPARCNPLQSPAREMRDTRDQPPPRRSGGAQRTGQRMGSIRQISVNRTTLLQPEHMVGRAAVCALRLADRYVSAQHAVVRWSGARWELKDLGSRNGTFLDGGRLKPGDAYPLRRGSKLAFGKLDEQDWEVADVTPPPPMAVPIDGSDAIVIEGDLLALPSSDDPRVTIYRGVDGAWVLELPDESITALHNLQTFEVGGQVWRFCCAEDLRTTSLAATSSQLEVARLHLLFSVSRDEEHVHLRVTCHGREFDLGARSHNYLLLTLARRRLADAAEGLPESTCGWIYQDELAHDPSMTGPQLNIDVFRIRRQFANIGVTDAANIIQRRPRTRQLRVGTGLLSIEQP